jgi:stage III sporulation protein SpoIIIAA
MIEHQTNQDREDLEALLAILPLRVRQKIEEIGRSDELLEIVMDLGRVPTARYVDGEHLLNSTEISQAEIDGVVANIGNFDDDNRAGIARTLHRISGIRNRRGQVVGLTCRVGRAVYGTIDIIADIIAEGHSILLLGRPGVGKTTMLREVARILAEEKRVIIVDTSNEIGGDGDIPHPAVGRARRMQVPRPSHQHETMIEAVENHNPEVIVIDEIGREQEASAARTINERAVQLIGTAHGNTLENLLLNPTLSDLVGGIESVTLSDEEARRRGTQKTVLERRAPPTFDVLIEIQNRQQLLVHRDVTTSVDAMLRGQPFDVDLRSRDEQGQISHEQQTMLVTSSAVTGRRENRPEREPRAPRDSRTLRANREGPAPEFPVKSNGNNGRIRLDGPASSQTAVEQPAERQGLNVFVFGVARNRLFQAAKQLKIRIEIVENLAEADVFLTLKSYYRKQRKLVLQAEQMRIPVYILRANTVAQMESFLAQALELDVKPEDPFDVAVADAEQGIQRVLTGHASVDLRPVNSSIRRYQHEMARQANLVSHSYGKEPNRFVRIFSERRNP